MWISVVLVSSCLLGQSLALIDSTVMKCIRDKGLTEFAQMILDTDVATALRGDGPFTVFAPSNDAIANMDIDVAAAIAKESTLLKQVVQYHVVEEYMVTPQLVQAGSINTMEGQELKVERMGGNIVLNNQSSLMSGDNTDIICNNGILHVVDTLLLPPVFSVNNIAAVLITRDDLFRDMFMALLLNNLTHILEESEFTLFAPTDLGFGRYSQLQNIRPGTPNAQQIFTEIFKYHMVPGRRTTHQLRDGQKLYTYHGYPIDITIDAGTIMVDHANVVEQDIAASNGVIHGIDHILFPEDLLEMLVAG